ncbi:cytochrome P450 4c3-like [Culex pipiens pallens]|uniref:cytochrome P450 4c3-like n=1 Tax=Culex pipiens pallens TaxID=42434 RepID=UPI00195462C6|nr:cytochrome P450 4c3-like [Culex pipiens pallens]
MFTALLLALLLLVVTWLVTTLVRNYATTRNLRRNLPSFNVLPSVPLLGSSHLFKDDTEPPEIFATSSGFHRRFGNDLIAQSFLNQPSLQVTSPEVVEQIINTRTINKSQIYDFMKPWINEGLLTAVGKKWAQRRKIITPAFHFKILEEFLGTFNQQAEVLVDKLREQVGQGDFNIYKYITLCTLDVISETAMGVKINAQDNPDSSYVKAVKEMADLILRRLFSALREFRWLFPFLKMAKQQKRLLNVLHSFTDSVIVTRKNQLENESAQLITQKKLEESDIYGKRKLTLLDLLLNVSIDGHPLSNPDIREEVDTFMAAGHDTTTSALSFGAYHIARNPAVQQKLYDEMVQVLGPDFKNTILTNSMLQDLKYLDMTIKEILRIHPSVPIIGRMSTSDMTINGTKLPTGIEVIIFIYAMHNNPEVFPEPDRFDPDRFNEENSAKRHPYAYIPFSAGARNCIGQKYALLEAKTILVKLLGSYRLLPCDPGNTVRIKSDITLRPVNGAFVKIVER